MVTSMWCKHFVQHTIMSVWRKKPLLLAVVMVFTVVVLAFQYHSVDGPDKTMDNFALQPDNGGPRVEARFADSSYNQDSNQLKPPRRNLSAIGDKPLYMSDAEAAPRAQRPSLALGEPFEMGAIGNPGKMRAINSGQSSANLNPGVVPGQQLTKGGYIPGLRLVHFDLKGAPPKISYLKQVFPLLKAAGANGIILEYEETFPFWGPLKPMASPTAYSKDDIKAVLDLAKIHDFEVIPLVQTFGHLEFALKLEAFRHLREVDQFPMAICPSKNESFNLVSAIIDQVMAMHPKSKWLHIGCDEVFHLGYCDKCRSRDRDSLYLSHVSRVATYVRNKYSVVPIVWDDMLRNIAPDRLRESGLGKLVEPMVWTYVRDVYRFIPYSTWLGFADVFPNIWSASAFKGAFGETLTVPNAKMHLENSEAWLEVMAEQERNFKSFRGIAVTGWQRYDHLATLCETFPAGLPSLVLNLITISGGKFDKTDSFKKFDKVLNCQSRSYYSGAAGDVNLDSDLYLWDKASGCQFPGSSVFRLTQHVADAVKRTNDYLYDVTVHKAWMTEYNVRHNMSNPFRVDEGLSEHSSVYYTLTSLVRTAEDALLEVFDKYTAAEWIEQNIYPYILKMEKVMKDAIDLKKARVWPRRPLPMLEDLKRFGVGGA
ncbi:hypothetical protein HDE_09718 [Halotydeus destructor]|nr:hypothetical protein HDE_09718 [Halotydeus destructor]